MNGSLVLSSEVFQLSGVVGVLVVVLVVCAAFLVGAINPASIFARVLGKDISTGSGNPGATNAGRVLGRWWGVLVGILDVIKGAAPALATLLLLGRSPAYLVSVAVVLGHVYSPFLKGRGGKGVAATLGAMLAVHPWYAVALAAVFALVFVVSRWVALGSLVAAGLTIVGGVLAMLDLLPGGFGAATALWAWALGVIVIVRHFGNIAGKWRELRASGDGST